MANFVQSGVVKTAARELAAPIADVTAFAEAAVYYRAREDGRIDDAEARRIADAADRLFSDIEEASRELARE